MSNCSSRGGGTREREIISQVNRNAFKHKQMKYLRSQIMAEMDVEISIIPLCILMGNICQACMVGEDRGFQGIAFFHLQDLKDFIPPWFWQPAFPSCSGAQSLAGAYKWGVGARKACVHCLMGHLQRSPQEQFSMEISFAEAERFISLHTKALLRPETAERSYHPGDLYFRPISDTQLMTNGQTWFLPCTSVSPALKWQCHFLISLTRQFEKGGREGCQL